MAKYFNPKEDVIEIQLTQYGKSLLSKGKFKPHSYAFFDNDILYNSRFAHLSESQNDAHQRIMDMTPRMQPQYVYRGIESDLQKNFDTLIADDINIEKVNIQQAEEKEYALGMPLGTSDPNSIYRPSWDVGFYQTPLSGAVMYHTGSSDKKEPIIQLECVYRLKSGVIVEANEAEQEQIDFSARRGYRIPYDQSLIEPYALSEMYDDDSFFYIQEDDYLFLDVVENNTSNELENFEIEVYKVEKESNPNTPNEMREILVPLKFFKPEEKTDFPEDEVVDLAISPDLDETYVEYYFNINTDADIDDGVFCELLIKFKKSKTHVNLFSDLNIDPDVNCDDYRFAHEFSTKEDELDYDESEC